MPTPCSLTQGHTPKVCKSSGGTKSFLIAEFDAITAITKTAGVITTITKASGKKFFRYKQKAEVAMWKQTGTGDPKVGTVAYDVEANIEMVGLDQVTQTELDLLICNTVVMIAEDNDGSYWYLGEDFGMDLATDGLESGTAIGDFRGNKLAFKGRGFTRVASVSSTIIAALLS
jgi:hypothetical protein